MKTMKRPTFAILALVLFSLPVAHAQTPTPSADTSAAPAPSGSVAAAPAGMAISAYAWPKEASEQPKEEEWAGATELEMVTNLETTGWSKKRVNCRQRALREWMRVECAAPEVPPKNFFLETQTLYGSLWGLAGDISSTSGQFQLASAVEAYAKNLDKDPKNTAARLMRAMGAIATVTFQAKYGSAMMVRLDEIFWAENYMGEGSVIVQPGILIDVSWALGEKYPTIVLHG